MSKNIVLGALIGFIGGPISLFVLLFILIYIQDATGSNAEGALFMLGYMSWLVGPVLGAIIGGMIGAVVYTHKQLKTHPSFDLVQESFFTSLNADK